MHSQAHPRPTELKSLGVGLSKVHFKSPPSDSRTPGQDGGIGKHCAHFLPAPHQNYSSIIEQTTLENHLMSAKQKPYN